MIFKHPVNLSGVGVSGCTCCAMAGWTGGEVRSDDDLDLGIDAGSEASSSPPRPSFASLARAVRPVELSASFAVELLALPDSKSAATWEGCKGESATEFPSIALLPALGPSRP